jgi:hypothetical protein
MASILIRKHLTTSERRPLRNIPRRCTPGKCHLPWRQTPLRSTDKRLFGLFSAVDAAGSALPLKLSVSKALLKQWRSAEPPTAGLF